MEINQIFVIIEMSVQMIRVSRHKITYLLLFIVLLPTSMGSTGCARTSYERVTINEGFALFSFEYPFSFEKSSIQAGTEGFSTADVFVGQRHDGSNRYELLLGVTVLKAGEGQKENAESWSNSCLETYKEVESDFNLISRSSVEINAHNAEQVIISYTMTPPYIDEEPVATTERYVMFDHNGSIYWIMVIHDSGLVETANAYFEHMLDTFEILN